MEKDPYRGHIIFDCDGTLISGQDGVLRCVARFMSDILAREVSYQEASSKYTPNIAKILEAFDVPQEIREDTVFLQNKWSELASEHSNDHPPYVGILPLLEKLGQENYALYVWTARDRRSTLEILKRAGIMPLIIEMRCLDDTIAKPHPQGIIELVGHVQKERVIVIGDSYTDIQGARSFGCASIGALWAEHAHAETLKSEGASYLAYNPLDCFDFIQGHFASKGE